MDVSGKTRSELVEASVYCNLTAALSWMLGGEQWRGATMPREEMSGVLALQTRPGG